MGAAPPPRHLGVLPCFISSRSPTLEPSNYACVQRMCHYLDWGGGEEGWDCKAEC